MDLAALGFWIATAMVGLYMLGITMRTGQQHSEAIASNIPSVVAFSHGFLALCGLAVWMLFMGYGTQPLAWGALAVLVLVALSGTHMIHRWAKDRKGSPEQVARNMDRLAEQQIPSSAVVMHGVLAFGTVGFVILSALFVADSS